MPRLAEVGVVPGSGLARLLARLDRPDRRLLLAVVTGARTKKRGRLERQLRGRLAELGLERETA